MPIQRVESVSYGVEDLDACARYYADFGLEELERGAGGATFRTLENQLVCLRGAGDASLPAAVEGGSTLRETVWGVDSRAGLEAIASELSRDREVRADAEGTLHCRDASGMAIGFRIASRIPADRVAPAVNVAGSMPRLNRGVDAIERVRPIRIIHVVYQLKKQGWQEASAFYLERLKFRLSDRSMNAGDFMRCEKSYDHHNLFLLHRPDRAGYNHIAFEVRDLDEMMLGGIYMKKHGWKAVRNPGRHFLGSNLEWFFENPCGGRTEFVADMDRMDEDWVPRVWEQHPGEAIWLFSPD